MINQNTPLYGAKYITICQFEFGSAVIFQLEKKIDELFYITQCINKSLILDGDHFSISKTIYSASKYIFHIYVNILAKFRFFYFL